MHKHFESFTYVYQYAACSINIVSLFLSQRGIANIVATRSWCHFNFDIYLLH